MAKTEEAPTPEDVQGRGEGLNAEMDGLRVKTWIWIGVAIAVVVLGFGAWWTYALDRGDMAMGGMGEMGEMGEVPRLPPVAGFYEGDQIAFVHTEASDPEIADMLTEMMSSPVLVVPELTQIPPPALAEVYVFMNGVEPEEARGPFGFQPDVFDSAPGDAEYSPLRRVNLVEWDQQSGARILDSVDEIEDADAAGLIEVEETAVVVNMPFVTWPGGER